MITFSDAAKKGLCVGALSFVMESMLHFKTIKHPLIQSVVNMTGVTVANYATQGNHLGGEFFQDWQHDTRRTVTIALAFFLSASCLRLANHFDRSIDIWTHKTDAILWLACYKAAWV